MYHYCLTDEHRNSHLSHYSIDYCKLKWNLSIKTVNRKWHYFNHWLGGHNLGNTLGMILSLRLRLHSSYIISIRANRFSNLLGLWECQDFSKFELCHCLPIYTYKKGYFHLLRFLLKYFLFYEKTWIWPTTLWWD